MAFIELGTNRRTIVSGGQDFETKMARGNFNESTKNLHFFWAITCQSALNCTGAWDLGYVSGRPEEVMAEYQPWPLRPTRNKKRDIC
jgi:hypothetical protein